MPRFDNEGFNPNKRINNDSRDRSVPEGENYYKNPGNDFGYGDRRMTGDVIDNQNKYTDVWSSPRDENLEPPQRNYRQIQQEYNPEVLRDFDAQRRRENREIARQRQQQPKQRSERPKHSGAAAKKRSKPSAKKILAAIIAVLLAILLSGILLLTAVLSRINYDDSIPNQYVASGQLENSMSVTNILLLGVDARPTEESETSRADTMMLVSIDRKHHCIKMTSFLRDTWVYVPAMQGEQRLNAASAYGGYSGVVDAIEYNFGIDIDGYVVADFEMFKVLVDSIGGVDVTVTQAEAKEVTNHKKRYGNVKLDAGEQRLTGEQALAYCRIRKIDTDFVRTKRQRTVIQSILKEVKKGNPFKLAKMALNSAPYIETNLSKGKLMLVAMAAATCLRGDMVQQKVPFEGTWEYAYKNGMSVIAINIEQNKQMLIDAIYNKTAEQINAENANAENG
ncbi:MAG: LCP family protein [Eubacterium sp.]|nr:LCP family protein [Eubacterium sp.]MBR0412199.1 LCP family protein [Eubacterium sp.]